MSNKFLIGVFDDDDVLLNAIRNIRSKGVKITDVFTPFAVHGIEDAMDAPPSRIPTAGFIIGLIGAITAFCFMTWVFTTDWPINVGGKPFFAGWSFVPITFEAMVFSASWGMVLVFLFASNLLPGIKNRIFHDRITNDKFVIVFDIEKKNNEQVQMISGLLKENGASEVNEKIFDK